MRHVRNCHGGGYETFVVTFFENCSIFIPIWKSVVKPLMSILSFYFACTFSVNLHCQPRPHTLIVFFHTWYCCCCWFLFGLPSRGIKYLFLMGSHRSKWAFGHAILEPLGPSKYPWSAHVRVCPSDKCCFLPLREKYQYFPCLPTWSTLCCNGNGWAKNVAPSWINVISIRLKNSTWDALSWA